MGSIRRSEEESFLSASLALLDSVQNPKTVDIIPLNLSPTSVQRLCFISVKQKCNHLYLRSGVLSGTANLNTGTGYFEHLHS